MFQKPLISNQYGAFVMAFVPFLYAIFASQWVFLHFWLGLTWVFVYLFSYPFLSLFTKKSILKYRQWAIIYAICAICSALPLLWFKPSILQFCLPILPLVMAPIHYAKQKNERHLLNDLSGLLIFGIVGMASFYVATNQYNIKILFHPTLFFIATTLYVKSVARERKNPLYLKWSIGSHLILGLTYLLTGHFPIAVAYAVGLIRAVFVPKQKWSIKQVGIVEFGVVLVLLVALYFT